MTATGVPQLGSGRRICGTRPWKLERRRVQGISAAAPIGPVVPPLFQGTVYVASVVFSTSSGPVGVAPEDLATVETYLARVAAPIEAYCGQYGVCRLGAGSILPPFMTPRFAPDYGDAELRGWVDTLVTENGLPPTCAVLVLNPPGVVNRDARERGGVGVLGYHGIAARPYAFVNLLGSDLTLDDHADRYAEAVSHELAEMTVDPRADDSHPEVCDGCGTNCQGTAAFRSYFDSAGRYLGSSAAFPPPFAYELFVSAIARPAVATDCPAPASGCAYPPPSEPA